ncbi:MAG: hypothetical protein KKF62_07415 [Bacteroidetes bacterium]|nr:hypothetical protein [Bacteroidota bacterium]MBU1116272.1 hypothetical protein [Bacteroidota bacterium]MBU1799308.1 hypothetical protein [Bacteroidota bacterium]
MDLGWSYWRESNFLSEDIADLTDNEIIDQIRKSTLSTKSDETIKRGKEFTFVNFNFIAE